MISPNQENTARTKVLLLLVAMNVAASMAHYADNIVRFADYPEPPWMRPSYIDGFWFPMTAFGIAAYWLYRRGRTEAAIWLNYVYGLMNLLVLGHYVYAAPWHLSFTINALIALETATGLALVAYTLRLKRVRHTEEAAAAA